MTHPCRPHDYEMHFPRKKSLDHVMKCQSCGHELPTMAAAIDYYAEYGRASRSCTLYSVALLVLTVGGFIAARLVTQ